MSPLLHDTKQYLWANARKASAPLFSNQIAQEMFDAKHTRGSLRVLPRTDGRFIVYDSERAFGSRTVSVHRSADDAHAAMVRV